MTEFRQAIAFLSPELRGALQQVPESIQQTVQEIRLRTEAPLTLSTPQGELWVSPDGQAGIRDIHAAKICPARQIEECFQALCEYSVHTHQEEISRGFVTTRSGCRVGLGGQTIVQAGAIASMQHLTSLCIRIARDHSGCARELAHQLTLNGHVEGALICGEPSSGKTSVLRDLARQLSSGTDGRRYRVTVVDERGELSANGWLNGCDVLVNCPKGIGIEQAVRCLAPDVILFDELGSASEAAAIRGSINCGAAVITTAHCHDLNSLMQRPFIADVMKTRAFAWLVLLQGRTEPGKIGRLVPLPIPDSASA